MEKKVLIILLLLAVTVQAVYIDGNYLWGTVWDSGNAKLIRADKGLNQLSLYNYTQWNETFTCGFSKQIRVSGQNVLVTTDSICDEIWLLNHSSSTATKYTRSGYEDMKGTAIIGDYAYIYSNTAKTLGKFTLDTLTQIDNVTITECSSGVSSSLNQDIMSYDDTYFYVPCSTYICRISETDLSYSCHNVTMGGIVITSVQNLVSDNNYIYLGYRTGSNYYLGRLSKTDLTTIINYYNTTGSTTLYQFEIIDSWNNYLYTIQHFSNEGSIKKFQKNLTLEKEYNISVTSGSEDSGMLTTDLNYIYYNKNSPNIANQTVFKFNNNLTLITNTTGVYVYGLGERSYKGDTGEGESLGTLNISLRYNNNPVVPNSVNCELYKNGVLIDLDSSGSNGRIIFNNLPYGIYNTSCVIDTGTYPNINGTSLKTQSIEIATEQTEQIFNWYSSAFSRINVTFEVVDIYSGLNVNNSLVILKAGDISVGSGYTDDNGEITFNINRCKLNVTATKVGYEDFKKEITFNINEEKFILNIIPNYQEGLPCLISGYMLENDIGVFGGLIRSECYHYDTMTYNDTSIVGSDGYYLMQLPDGQSCEFYYLDTNNKEHFINRFTPLSYEANQYDGICSYCICEYNESFSVNTERKIYLKDGDIDIIEPTVYLNNETNYITTLYPVTDSSGSYYFTDKIANYKNYTIEIISKAFLSRNESIIEPNGYDKVYEFELLKNTSLALITLNIKSLTVYDNEDTNTKRSINIMFNDRTNGYKYSRNFEATDNRLIRGVQIMEMIQPYSTYEISIECNEYTGDTITVSANGRPSITGNIKLYPKLKYSLTDTSKSVFDLILKYGFYLGIGFFGIIVLFFVVVGIKLLEEIF